MGCFPGYEPRSTPIFQLIANCLIHLLFFVVVERASLIHAINGLLLPLTLLTQDIAGALAQRTIGVNRLLGGITASEYRSKGQNRENSQHAMRLVSARPGANLLKSPNIVPAPASCSQIHRSRQLHFHPYRYRHRYRNTRLERSIAIEIGICSGIGMPDGGEGTGR